jgi:hypothetical protein
MVTTAREIITHPGVYEAAPRVGKGSDLKDFAADAGLDQPAIPELDDIESMRREGTLTPDDEAHMAAAAEEAKTAEAYAVGYETMASCILRHGAP